MSHAAPALRLFISYSHKDAKLKDQLLEHLEVVRRFEGVDVWTDDLIEPGANPRDEIERGLASADVAILLVSPSFLASRFIQDNAVPDILARQASQGLLVVPVIMRDCAWQEHPVIQPLQALPRTGEPITRHKGNRRDRAFMEVATEIAKLAKKRAASVDQDEPPTHRAPPPRESSLGRAPPPRESSHGRVPPPRESSLGRVPPPRESSTGRGYPTRDSSTSLPSFNDRGLPSFADRDRDRDSPSAEWTGQIRLWDVLGVVSNLEVDRHEDDLVGRSDILEQVRETLDARAGRGAVLFGMTGMGKTWIAQVIASAARREATYPGGVFWLPGGSH